MGRRLEQRPENYNLANFREGVDRSRRNLRTDALDLVQLHCPPTAVYSRAEVYDGLDTLVAEGAIRNYGVSVERTDEALEAMRHAGTASVQIILNAFRLKPLDEVLPAAKAAGVGIIARVPLASGLLSGKYTKETVFAADDHRNYNRGGDAFDVGETFSGVDFELGLKAVAEFEQLVPEGAGTAQAAIAWVAAQDGVTSVIPGARSVEQARANAAAAATVLSPEFHEGVRWIYDHYFREAIHPRW
jgi:aryl-alcohol dehydrogenase-like predicted oxidoreductase